MCAGLGELNIGPSSVDCVGAKGEQGEGPFKPCGCVSAGCWGRRNRTSAVGKGGSLRDMSCA